ncbi:MAG: hypothetical protein IJV31_11180 [Clostridia bacterium]|nr:hypothetical protein [Clostridia bacterium]
MEKNKQEQYILKQKNKYMKLINAKGLMSAFKLAYRKGDLILFSNFLEEIEGIDEFIKDAFSTLWGENSFVNNIKRKEDLAQFVSEQGIKSLTRKYGEKFGNKVLQKYKDNKLNYYNIYVMNNKTNFSTDNTTKNAEIMNCLFDIFTNENLKAGIHRTGGHVSGQQVLTEGLNLTGDSSSGVSAIGLRISDIEKNVSFYEKNPGTAITQIAEGGNYKNYGNNKKVDIIIVTIPKECTKEEEEKIILKFPSGQNKINPEYIWICNC